MKQVSVNDVISIGNALIGVVPKLVLLVGFCAMVLLLIKAFKARNALSITELAAIVIAIGIAARGL